MKCHYLPSDTGHVIQEVALKERKTFHQESSSGWFEPVSRTQHAHVISPQIMNERSTLAYSSAAATGVVNCKNLVSLYINHSTNYAES